MADNPSKSSPNEPVATEQPYEVGYGKPPKHTRFQKGNKLGKGRAKRSKNLASLVQEIFDVKVTAKVNGTPRKLSKLELGLQQLANKAGSGDLKAIVKMLELSERHSPIVDDTPPSEEHTAYDIETLRHYFTMRSTADDD